jgi:hypothetical protein
VNARVWISLVNLAAIAIAFAVLFVLPQFATYAFYGLLGWILLSFFLLYGLRVGRTNPSVGTPAATPGASGASGPAPLPSAIGGGPSVTLDFCMYCGASLPPATPVCPACGHAVRAI